MTLLACQGFARPEVAYRSKSFAGRAERLKIRYGGKGRSRQPASLHVGNGSSLKGAKLCINPDQASQILGPVHKRSARMSVGINGRMAGQKRARLAQFIGGDVKTNGGRPGVLDEIASDARSKQFMHATAHTLLPWEYVPASWRRRAARLPNPGMPAKQSAGWLFRHLGNR